MLDTHLGARSNLGFWNCILDLILDPRNPFEPGRPRPPRKDFVLAVILVGLPIGAVVYFNLWS